VAGYERVAVDAELGVSVASSTLRNDTPIDLVQARYNPETPWKRRIPVGWAESLQAETPAVDGGSDLHLE
jgi:hypothetical protein